MATNKNVKQYVIGLHIDKQKEIIDHLNSKPNKNQYIKNGIMLLKTLEYELGTDDLYAILLSINLLKNVVSTENKQSLVLNNDIKEAQQELKPSEDLLLDEVEIDEIDINSMLNF